MSYNYLHTQERTKTDSYTYVCKDVYIYVYTQLNIRTSKSMYFYRKIILNMILSASKKNIDHIA